jgi:integrase/recombinase XerD
MFANGLQMNRDQHKTMVTIKPYLDCRKQKQDGTYPLKIRVTSNRKSFYLPTSFSLEQKFWDQKKLRVKSNHHNYKWLNLSLAKRLLEIEETMLQHESAEQLSPNELRQHIGRTQNPLGVSPFTRQLISKMEAENKHGNAQVYVQALSKLESHFGSNLSFENLNHSLLTTFQERMMREGMSVNGMSTYLCTLRAVYNKAIEANLVDRGKYPFHRFKYIVFSALLF